MGEICTGLGHSRVEDLRTAGVKEALQLGSNTERERVSKVLLLCPFLEVLGR